jgi:signal transduction histidine kinase
VVHGIIAQHGGTIEIDSQDGEGAAFILTLPAYQDGAEPIDPEKEQQQMCRIDS